MIRTFHRDHPRTWLQLISLSLAVMVFSCGQSGEDAAPDETGAAILGEPEIFETAEAPPPPARTTRSAGARSGKPNILVIWGDDIGMWNISAYHRGMMGGSTPNIDRIANEGAMFTDFYAEQSCTAGRASFITGQHPFRTGLLTIGMPGSDSGIHEGDATLAELLKNHGYTTAQFGKNHLGDRNEFLPTVHGFDEFYGNLYHLNSEEEPEDPDYPEDPAFHNRFGPRGVLDCVATDEDDPTEEPRWGRVGKQRCKDTGPLTRKRMETADEEFLRRSLAFMEKAADEGKPFFLWHNSTRMHVWTRLQPKYRDKSGYGLYADGMMELDDHVGALLRKLDELGLADDTIVVFSTDNGAETFTWPDGGNIPFRGYKGTTWEGGFRVPALVRWPGLVKPGTVINGVMSHQDWVPTLMAAAGEPDIAEKLKRGYEADGKDFKVHLDGYDQRDLLAGTGPSKRREIFFFDDQASLNAVRVDDWKLHFTLMEDWIAGGKRSGWPKVINLRQDPFERMIDSQMYFRWYADKMWTFVPAQTFVARFLATFQEFPPKRSSSLSVNQVLEKLVDGSPGGN
jgi:arylsulfatase